MKKYIFKLIQLFALLFILTQSHAQFRIYPYWLPAEEGHLSVTWVTELPVPGQLTIWEEGKSDTVSLLSQPRFESGFAYSELEESQRDSFPDMFKNANWKHHLIPVGLRANTLYHYRVVQGEESYTATIKTMADLGSKMEVQFAVFADCETDPDGRKTYRKWSVGSQASMSSGRPDEVQTYLITETEGFNFNLESMAKSQPDFYMLPGDIVQGGGYQRAWDEFFYHMAGKFNKNITTAPLLPAIGNWENFGARNGGYEPQAVAKARNKYRSYFNLPANNNPQYKNYYYRTDYGPVTVITLDSSNGLPDSTDFDTNINISASTYPGDDLPDINPGSDQWKWAMEELEDASSAGQIIFVQFHHIPYSSGGHSLPLTAYKSSGQAGIPMRAYTPAFKKYGVVAVFCGHNESLEHSIVDGIHFWDIGIAGDGFGYSIDDIDARRKNIYRQWVAHRDAEEMWNGQQLISGGKHYGHLWVEVVPNSQGYDINMTPKYIFPVTDKEGKVTMVEERIYDHVVKVKKSMP
ncbi:metallophosphoesterase family protein [Membranihabitans marinus]|uniref:metallophosphoesterase family protein n=1 Tax=Membranihabitans marinus TaxID=1227546 RepID=UPI001F41B15A|nr:metallophosphoesterase [Membranihabitans marinus]